MRSPEATRRLESDLGEPIQRYLEANGYTVRSEVRDCDITAVQGDELIVIELKRGFTTDLLLQATDRQRVADAVYVALPADGTMAAHHSKRRQAIERLLKRLELGLILVAFPEGRPPEVDVAFHPLEHARPRRAPRTRRVFLREIAGRSSDYNIGGSCGRKIVTAYREQAIFIACCLDRFGAMSPGALRALGAGLKTQDILFRNVYDWFDRQERGRYALRQRGRDEIAAEYSILAANCRHRLDQASTRIGLEPPPGGEA
jgi:hypothetical protein